MPRPITTIQCHLLQGRRSIRAGISVVTGPVCSAAVAIVASVKLGDDVHTGNAQPLRDAKQLLLTGTAASA